MALQSLIKFNRKKEKTNEKVFAIYFAGFVAVFFACCCFVGCKKQKAEPEHYTYEEFEDGYAVSGFLESEIENMQIPETYNGKKVLAISNWAFSGVFKIKTVSFSDNMKVVGIQAFNECLNIKSIDFGGVTTIYDNAFKGCAGLREINIPDSVVSVGNGIFLDCSRMQSATVGAGLTKIADGMFARCSQLSEVSIPNHVTLIDDYAFQSCFSFSEFVFPTALEEIGFKAFFECSGLTQLVFPSSIKTIESEAFAYCGNLQKIEFSGETNWSEMEIAGDALPENNMTIAVAGTDQATIETALTKLATLDGKSQYTIQIDASLAGSISNTYGFAGIDVIQ